VSRRKHHEEHENHERWLVSYADFITLMFAFFVVMFATSEADKAKTKAVATAVENALKDDKFSERGVHRFRGRRKCRECIRWADEPQKSKSP
jgi:chemotaxis protein MotB